MTIVRTPLFFGPEQRSLFGWYHAPEGARRELAVVICPPFGHEYINAHRSLRHLADRLAEQGIAALRFDYDGTGDSAGGDTEAARVAAWRESIVVATRELSTLSGCEQIALLGLRLGATLALSVANEIDVAALVLWAPCLRGRTYVRELKALHLTGGNRDAESEPGHIEPGGFLVTADTQLELGCLDAGDDAPKTTHAFIGLRDDLTPDNRLREQWSAAGISVEQRLLSGYHDMTAEPHHTKVPDSAIAQIVNWLTEVAGPPTTTHETPEARTTQTIGELRETLVRFGANDALFGIVSEPIAPIRASAATILLPNAGSTHHVGPNRLYVFIARALSRAGFRVLRFDLPGLGDSVIDDPSRENHPYIASTPDALAAAIAMLHQQRSPTSFVLIGLCSGAYASLHAALQLDRDPIVESILINPLTFYWEEGMSLDRPVATEEFDKWQWYMKSMRSRDRWAKLFRGDVNVRSIARTVVERVRGKVSALCARDDDEPRRNDLERDLTRIAESGRKVTFLFSRFDPGFDLLMASAGRAVKSLRKRGLIDVWRSEAATHTFEEQRSRELMIESLARHLAERYLA
ncbi:MAG: hypothetical protein JWO97_3454 [Acidobacteria bacterium]|nr:hypothetical protein [Acidobacteriota bacterium]